MAISDTIHNATQTGREGAESAASAVSQSVAAAARSTEEAINRTVASGRDTMRSMGESASKHMSQWKQKGIEGAGALKGQVERNALVSTAIAFVVGFALARVLFRK